MCFHAAAGRHVEGWATADSPSNVAPRVKLQFSCAEPTSHRVQPNRHDVPAAYAGALCRSPPVSRTCSRSPDRAEACRGPFLRETCSVVAADKAAPSSTLGQTASIASRQRLPPTEHATARLKSTARRVTQRMQCVSSATKQAGGGVAALEFERAQSFLRSIGTGLFLAPSVPTSLLNTVVSRRPRPRTRSRYRSAYMARQATQMEGHPKD
jgi:hypothetical protein